MDAGTFLGIDARIWQALIAGSVVAAGWLWNGWRDRRDARRLRAERLRDYHKALFAEIRNALSAYWDEGEATEDSDRVLRRMEAEPDYVPFIPRERHDRVFAALVQDIEVLPRQTIDVVVAFYSQVDAIAALADDMRGEGYAESGPIRRIAIYSDWIEMRARAFALGQNVLRLIDTYSAHGPRAADRLLSDLGYVRVNTPDADPSDPEDRETG
ncbi:hypothetical protein [Jannaschia rubra]|uniref:Uncharacterized protein n=1 Tax=Jannaschia rubra TaxID=282197 RepID=A0A0M6XQX9_9RHOB|nr:hypothetical protein [Jannaschia rubra]CTQ33017.1 hypothetical protein JAN5088_01792 [Jannaschia rubra]SFG58617.1 hypothetical protein SAMN04488517_10737 [Jannaschia rubra]